MVGARNKIYALCQPVNRGGSKDGSLWVIDQFGTKEKELPLNNENQNLNCPVQDSNGYIYVSTGRGKIYKIDPVTEANTVIFTEPTGQQFTGPLKIDPDNQLYALMLQKLYCLNNSGTVLWSYQLTSNKFFMTKMPTIFIGGNRVFISYNDQDTYPYHTYLLSINRQTGSMVQTRIDCGGPPSVGPDGTVYAIGTSSLYALNSADISGTSKWTKNLGSDKLAANTPVIGVDGTLYLLSKTSTGGVYNIKCQAINPDDGATKWEVTYDAAMADDISQGYVAGNNVVVFTVERSNNYQLYAYRDAGDHAELLWSQSYGTSAGDLAFGPGATIYVLPDTGLGHTIYALSEGAVGDPYGAGRNFQDNIPPVIPANPAPADKTQNIDSQVTLSWNCSSPSGHPLKYSLFVGELDNQMFPLATDVDCPSYTLSNLKPNTGYLWKIVVSDGQAVTEGPTWVFAAKPINCDLNADSYVDFADYAIFARHWLETCPSSDGCEGADINWDKTVNINDLALFVSNWLKTTGTFCTYLNWTPDAGIRIFGTYNAAIPRFIRALPGGGWGMYYYEGNSWTYGDTGYATSDDGSTWTRVGKVMTHGGHGFDNVNAVITDIVNLTDGDLRAYCEGMAFTGSGASNIFIADSTDGINWVNPQVVFVPQSGTLYSNQVSCPRIINVGGEFIMYFVGSDDTTSRIFKTTSSDGISNWTPPQMAVEPPTGGSLGSFYIVNCPETGRLRMFITTQFSTDSGDCTRSLISVDNGSNWTWEDGIRLAPNEYGVENLICPVLAEIAGSGKMYIGGGHGGVGGGHWDTLSATCE